MNNNWDGGSIKLRKKFTYLVSSRNLAESNLEPRKLAPSLGKASPPTCRWQCQRSPNNGQSVFDHHTEARRSRRCSSSTWRRLFQRSCDGNASTRTASYRWRPSPWTMPASSPGGCTCRLRCCTRTSSVPSGARSPWLRPRTARRSIPGSCGGRDPQAAMMLLQLEISPVQSIARNLPWQWTTNSTEHSR